MSIICYNPNMPFTVAETLTSLACANCAILFAIPDRFQKARQADHETFYCPAGHTNFYPGHSKEEQLANQIAHLQRRREFAEARERDLRTTITDLKKKNSVQKGLTTRIKNRIQAGVCPCCNRTFQDLAMHMAGQHPQFTKTE